MSMLDKVNELDMCNFDLPNQIFTAFTYSIHKFRLFYHRCHERSQDWPIFSDGKWSSMTHTIGCCFSTTLTYYLWLALRQFTSWDTLSFWERNQTLLVIAIWRRCEPFQTHREVGDENFIIILFFNAGNEIYIRNILLFSFDRTGERHLILEILLALYDYSIEYHSFLLLYAFQEWRFLVMSLRISWSVKRVMKSIDWAFRTSGGLSLLLRLGAFLISIWKN